MEGTEGYRDFAGPDWPGFTLEEEIATFHELLRAPDFWCLVAEEDGALVGQVTVQAAASTRRPVDDASLAHLRNLFVRSDRWGSGLARELHDAALAEARERGFTAMRLFAAAGQTRARRFYEREGWVQQGDPSYDPAPGLEMVEYRIALR